jgi:hypothetical protein
MFTTLYNKMPLLTRENAITLCKNFMEIDYTEVDSIAKDIVSQSYSFDDVLRNIRYHLRTAQPGDTFVVSVLHNPIRNRQVIEHIGPKMISERVQILLEEKYRGAFPDFPIEKDKDSNFTFYVRVTL